MSEEGIGLEPQAPKEEDAGRIVLENLRNTRDLGYLTTSYGQRILPQKLIRSGALGEASEEDISTLTEVLEVRTVIDLRTPDEQAKNPDPLDKMPLVRFVDEPILGFSTTGVTRENGLMGLAKSLATLKSDPRKLMKDLYPNMLLDEQGIKGYSNFFTILADNEGGAVLWHCSVGKDRAGLATALLLHVLEVAPKAILADYLATNRYLAGGTDEIKKVFPPQLLSEGLIQSLHILNSADESFFEAGIEGVRKAYGSVDGYLAEALGVDDAMKEELRHKYVAS